MPLVPVMPISLHVVQVNRGHPPLHANLVLMACSSSSGCLPNGPWNILNCWQGWSQCSVNLHELHHQLASASDHGSWHVQCHESDESFGGLCDIALAWVVCQIDVLVMVSSVPSLMMMYLTPLEHAQSCHASCPSCSPPWYSSKENCHRSEKSKNPWALSLTQCHSWVSQSVMSYSYVVVASYHIQHTSSTREKIR